VDSLQSAKSGAALPAARAALADLSNLVTIRVVGPSVVAIANSIAIAVAIHATDYTVSVVISTMWMTAIDRVGDAAGQTANHHQHYSKFLHIVSPWRKRGRID
jgi:hypothetical protein